MLNLNQRKALEQARSNIENRTDFYVCLALKHLVAEEVLNVDDYVDLRSRIMVLLEGSPSLELWLMNKGHAQYPDLYPIDGDEYDVAESRRRLTRVHWINWMMEEL